MNHATWAGEQAMITRHFPFAFSVGLTALGILTATSVFAADTAHDESSTSLGFGIHGGVNLNDLKIDKNVSSTINANENGETGALLGVHFEFGGSQVMIRPEINYSVHKYNFSNLAEVSHKFLEVPVLLKVAMLPSPIQPFVEIGPQFGFHLSDDTTALGATTTFNDSSHTMNVAGVAGAGLRLDLIENLAIEAEGRYVFGFTDISENNDVTVKSRGFQILGGLTSCF
jgi:opacity protein-like surface antigen